MMAGSSLRSSRQALAQFVQFAGVGKLAEPEQVAGLFKSGMIGEFVNVDAAVGENALVPIDVADAGICGDDALKTFWGMICGHAGHALARSVRGMFGVA